MTAQAVAIEDDDTPREYVRIGLTSREGEVIIDIGLLRQIVVDCRGLAIPQSLRTMLEDATGRIVL